jgi:hypothetical protein
VLATTLIRFKYCTVSEAEHKLLDNLNVKDTDEASLAKSELAITSQ